MCRELRNRCAFKWCRSVLTHLLFLPCCNSSFWPRCLNLLINSMKYTFDPLPISKCLSRCTVFQGPRTFKGSLNWRSTKTNRSRGNCSLLRGKQGLFRNTSEFGHQLINYPCPSIISEILRISSKNKLDNGIKKVKIFSLKPNWHVSQDSVKDNVRIWKLWYVLLQLVAIN